MITRFFLLAACALAILMKFHSFWEAPGFERDERTMYWSESAMHLYMADQVARGESLLERDHRAQSAEGIVLGRDVAPAMPWLAGELYRLWPGEMPIDVFVAYLFLFYSSLTVIGVYLWGSILFPSRLIFSPALVGALLYAVSAPAFARSVGAFIKEDFALPFLTMGFAFLFMSFRGRSFAAGVCVALALVGWHFSQFMLLVYAVALVLSLFVNGPLAREQARALALFTGILALTGMLFPMLRATAFVVSPPMALLYGILAWHYGGRRSVALIAFMGSLALYAWLGLAEQSHIFGLVLDKLRFGLIKPDDPSRLSYETRSNWIEDFNSPGLGFILYTVSFYVPLGLTGLWLMARRARLSRESFVFALYGLVFFFFFILARRMITMDIIFLCVAAGGLLSFATGRARRVTMLILALAFGFEAWKSWNYEQPNAWNAYVNAHFPNRDLPEAFTVAEHRDVLNWIRANVPPDQPVLASMGFSPVILYYAGRPILIHAMFDAKEMRDKEQAFVESLYGNEDQFYEFAKRGGAKYFVYEARNLLMEGVNSDRYVAGWQKPAEESAVHQFHYQPEGLKHFKLVYQNTAYRIFALDEGTAPQAIQTIPVYEKRAAGHESEVIRFLNEVREMNRHGFQSATGGDVREGVAWWEQVSKIAPYTVDLRAQLCLGYLILQNLDAARTNCEAARRDQPHSPTTHYHWALFYERTGQPEEARSELLKALRIDPRYRKAEQKLSRLSQGRQ